MYTSYSSAPMQMQYSQSSSSMSNPVMSSNSDRIVGGGFLGPFLLGGITGGLVAPFFYGPGYGYNRPYYYNNYYYYPYPYYGPYYR